MQKKQLGNTDMELTPIGFGSWAIGGAGWAYGWGAQDDGNAIEAIERAVELGINWIDTAAVYGLGHSEELVGKAVGGMKQRPYIFTKCSMVWNAERQVGFSLKADSIRRECEASLKRLQVDAIDLYQMIELLLYKSVFYLYFEQCEFYLASILLIKYLRV